jgi:RluA family pseudouridine synthase
MIIRQSHIVPRGVHGTRLSDYARNVFAGLLSKKGVAKALKRGEFRVDGITGKSGDWVASGQLIELLDLQQSVPKPYALPLDIVFEDEFIAVIKKPAGIEVSGNKFRTIENALVDQVNLSGRADALPWPRPVHRLDYATSGLLLVAKTASAQRRLGQAFENREVNKVYTAIVQGEVSAEGEITEPIQNLSAHSHYERIDSVQSLRNGHLSMVQLKPVTGRTHQLRIHMASIGHPIVGDTKYGKEGNVMLGKGLFLTASKLELRHPESQQQLYLSVEPPPKFSALMKREQERTDKYSSGS